MLPAWLRVWWDSFGSAAELYLRAVRQKEPEIVVGGFLIPFVACDLRQSIEHTNGLTVLIDIAAA